MHHLALIQQTCVQGTVLADLLASQEAQRTDAVVEVDKDNVSTRGMDHFGAVVVVIRVVGVAATLDIEPDGQFGLGRCIGRLEDVDKQTIFVTGVIWHLVDANANLVKLFPVPLALALGTGAQICTYFRAILHASLFDRVLWCSESEISKRGFGKAHSQELVNPRFH